MSPSYLPVTIDPAFEVDPDAPRSQGMDDDTAARVVAGSEEYRSENFHVRADVADRTVTLTVSNAPDGQVLFAFGDGSADVAVDATAEGPSATVEHLYLTDGVFTAQALIGTDRAVTQVYINWPPYEAEEPA